MLRLEFCRLTDLDVNTKRIIHRRMSWRYGDMREWLRNPGKNIHLCLLYKTYLTTWISLKHVSPSLCDVTGWTSSKYRGRGFAQTALWALIDHHCEAMSIAKDTKFIVHHETMAGVVKRLGYKACHGRGWSE